MKSSPPNTLTDSRRHRNPRKQGEFSENAHTNAATGGTPKKPTSFDEGSIGSRYLMWL